MTPLIKLENVSYSYPGDENLDDVYAVKNLSLEINEGEFIAILGHNGSGKSTIAKLMNIILEPNEGKVFVEGKDMTGDKITENDIFNVRKNIGMVFQNPDNQIVATIVEEDVAFGPENLGIKSSEIRKRVDEALEIVDMSDYARRPTHKLSGGQKQRVAIAGVIAMKPKCIILDESTAMLDPIGRKEVMKTITKLNKEENITIILITHYMTEAVQADRIVVMKNGEIYLDGKPNDVFSKPEKLWDAGIEVPQSVELIYNLNEKLGYNIPLKIYSDEECADKIIEVINKKDANS